MSQEMKLQREESMSISSKTTTSSRTVNKNVDFAKLFQRLLHSSCNALRLPHIQTQRETSAS